MRRRRFWLILGLSLSLLLAAVVTVLAVEAIARTRSWGDHEEGEVLVDGKVVMRIRSAAGGYSAARRAEQVAARLNGAFGAGETWRGFRVGEMNGETAVVTSKGGLIATADRFHAQANGTTPLMLARAWDSNLVQALGGSEATPPATADPVSAVPDVDWTRQADKIVPIFSIGTPGVSVGAARVVGPQEGVSKVKAVAQIEVRFKDVVRVYAYIPVSSISIHPERVQGASVEALIDYNLPF